MIEIPLYILGYIAWFTVLVLCSFFVYKCRHNVDNFYPITILIVTIIVGILTGFSTIWYFPDLGVRFT